MTYNEKKKIIATAIELINLLEDCNDMDFVDDIIECVASGDTQLIETDSDEELPY